MQLYRLRFLRAIVFGVIILIAFIFCFYELINLGKTNKSSVTSAAVIASSFTGSTNTSTVNFLNEGVTNSDTNHRSIMTRNFYMRCIILVLYQKECTQRCAQ